MKKNNLWWYIAWRFFRGKNKTQVINILTTLSIVAVSLLIAAFIIIVSVFNGFDEHFQKLYSGIYPELAIYHPDRVDFPISDSLQQFLDEREDLAYARVLESRAFANYSERHSILKLKGVDSSYLSIVDLDINSVYDNTAFQNGEKEAAFFSYSTGEALGLSITFDLLPIELSLPRYTRSKLINDQISTGYIYPKGAYYTDESEGEKEMLTDYTYLANLSDQYDIVSSIAIAAREDAEDFVEDFHAAFPQLDLLTKEQQNASVFKIINTERYMVYMILGFMLLLSSLNIIGVVLMTIIEKRRDISLFRALGSQQYDIRGIFLRLGIIIGSMGVVIGLVIGLIIALGQQEFGWVMMDTQYLVQEPFPVRVRMSHVLFIVLLGFFISVLASWIPSLYVSRSMAAMRNTE